MEYRNCEDYVLKRMLTLEDENIKLKELIEQQSKDLSLDAESMNYSLEEQYKNFEEFLSIHHISIDTFNEYVTLKNKFSLGD